MKSIISIFLILSISVVYAQLPSPWQSSDIGSVAATGGVTYDEGIFTIEGSGNDIWNAYDEFHYVYQDWSGDVEIIVKVESIDNTNAWAKSGIMIRENLSNGSRHASLFVTPANGVNFQRREVTASTSYNTQRSGIAAPVWLKIKKTGSTILTSFSANSQDWEDVGQITGFDLPSSYYIGLAVTAHNDGALCESVVKDVSINGVPLYIPPPFGTINFTQPVDSSKFYVDDTVDISAEVTLDINYVDFPVLNISAADGLYQKVLISPNPGGVYTTPYHDVTNGGLNDSIKITMRDVGGNADWVRLGINMGGEYRYNQFMDHVSNDDEWFTIEIPLSYFTADFTNIRNMILVRNWDPGAYSIAMREVVFTGSGDPINDFYFFGPEKSNISWTTPTTGDYVINIGLDSVQLLVDEVAFFANGAIIDSDTILPYEASFLPSQLGSNTVNAVAQLSNGSYLYSDTLSIFLEEELGLSTPTSLTASRVGVSALQLNWQDNSGNETGFEIERKSEADTIFSLLTTVSVDSTSYVDQNLDTILYTYRVRAINAQDTSNYSNEISASIIGSSSDSIPGSLLSQLKDLQSLAPPVSRAFYYNSLQLDQPYEVFQAPPCLEGEYILVYQLGFDLGNRSTVENWMAYLELELLKDDVSVWTKGLELNSEDQQFLFSVFHDQAISCEENYTFIIREKNRSGAIPEGNIVLSQWMYRVNDGQYNPSATFNLSYELPVQMMATFTMGDGTDQDITITWEDGGEGVIEYELEWVFIDSLEAELVFNPSTALEAFGFYNPVRINTKETGYTLTPYYPSGQLWFRVRSVGINQAYPDHRINGIWQYGPGTPVFIDNPQPDKNWQLQTSYAEDGKYKKVMNYFDGNLNGRQIITNLSSEGYAMVGETLYDYEGRPAVDIIPVPDGDPALFYKPSFNVFDPTDATIQDHTSAIRHKFNYDNELLENSGLSDQSGAGSYYSPQNTLAGIHQDYIPDSKGYAYSQRSYTPDNTGRLRKQSGIGEQFRIDNDPSTTRFFYSSAAQAELSRLFGSNVGEADHYKKNAVVDPNGQLSISYLDQEGRVVATALAGEKPENVEGLESYNSLPTTDIIVDISDKNEQSDNISKISHRILNTGVNTGYTFTYDLSAIGSDLEEIGCQSCLFDLKITIIDNKGGLMDLSGIAGNESGSGFSYEKKDLSATDCLTPGALESISIPVTFAEVGEYVISKELIAHELTFEEIETIVNTKTTVQDKITEIENTIVVDAADCDICETCTEAEAIIDEAITSMATQNCENIKQQIIQDILATQEAGYEVTQEDLEAHPDYCHYELCVQDKGSDVFDTELSRYDSWDVALSNGYNNAQNLDPFFNNPTMSGYDYKTNFTDHLNNITIEYTTEDNDGNATTNPVKFTGSITAITDPTNTSYYLNEDGDPDPVNGYHVLYWDLMSQEAGMDPVDYQTRVDQKRWSLYKSYYQETKRQIKLEIPAINGCAALSTYLEVQDQMPTDTYEIESWGETNGAYDSVSSEEIVIVMDNITSACNITLTTADSLAVNDHLQSYFDSHPANVFRLIINTDLTTDPDLQSIQNILNDYSCGLDSVALADPITCLRDTIIFVQAPGAAQAMTMMAPQTVSVSALQEDTGSQSVNIDEKIQREELLYYESMMDSIIQAEQEAYLQEYKEKYFPKFEDVALERTDKNVSINSINSVNAIGKSNMDENLKNRVINEDPYLKEIDAMLREEERKREEELDNLMNLQLEAERQKYLEIETVDSFGEQVTPGVSLMATTIATVPQTERDALIALYNATDGDNWTGITEAEKWKQNGEFTDDISNWYGISIANDSISTIQLGGKGLNGFIPDEIGNLKRLTTLRLENNQITGEIPSTIGNIKWLGYLILDNNQLKGSIPKEIGNLRYLRWLRIQNNEISGSIPTEIGNCVELQFFLASNNQLSGPIPREIGNFSNLDKLFLDDNQLTGSIPSEIGNLISLIGLALNNNNLTGSIPPELGGLPNLNSYLVLDNNQLDGSIPPELGNLTDLDQLYLNNNQLSGSIPVELANMSSLTRIYLNNNQLTGSIPSELGSMSMLHSLYLDNNNLTGDIPFELGNSSISGISLSHNKLTGSIPPELGNGYRSRIYLNNNQLSGNVPGELGLLGGALYYLHLSNNNLSGKLPENLTNLTNLSEFSIEQNSFTIGNIVEEYTFFSNIDEFTYSPQDSVEIGSIYQVTKGDSISLISNIDRNTNPSSKYQWFKYIDGVNDIPLIPEPVEAGHTFIIDSVTALDTGYYYYKIVNEALPDLTLSSRMQKVELEDPSGHEIERNALIAFYNSTDGDNWTGITPGKEWKQNGEFTDDISTWYGVYLDGEANVIQVVLPGKNLVGNLPTEIGDLNFLTDLILDNNQLSGAIPGELYGIDSLTRIVLSNNDLTGNISSNVGNLTKLHSLWLDKNDLSDSIPNEIGSLVNLESLLLNGNDLTGNIPTTIGNCVKLKTIWLNDNRLSGGIPSSIGNLLSLDYLYLGNNLLSNSIPTEIGNLDSLRYMYLFNNQLTGSIPSTIGNISELQYIYLFNNRLTGSIPPEIGNLSNLGALLLSNNSISGDLPPEIGNLTNLYSFWLSSNSVSGSIPVEIGNLVNMQSLLLNSNQLSGSIPSDIGNLNSMHTLNLSYNDISGSIPVEISNLPELSVLLLDHNNLIGPIPAELGQLPKLRNLWIDNNELSGNVPVELSNVTTLQQLYIHGNNLYGNIPDEFSSLINLDFFYLYENGFTFSDIDNINPWFNGESAYLQYTPQDSVDISEIINVNNGQSLVLEATIDRNTTPKCNFQWYKNGVALNTLDTAGHTVVINNFAEADAGNYHYIITNDSLPALTLYSRFKQVQISSMIPKVVCLEYDQNNPTLQQMSVVIDLEQEKANCIARLEEERTFLVERAIETLIEEEVEQFYSIYRTNCLEGATESMSYSYTPKEYHYTLYYYDQAGNLVQTVPPKGVDVINQNHTLKTNYRYNSLNQLTWQNSPDGGVSQFWYDSKGQLRASQNAKQATENKYSYTKYDPLGRITEVGEVAYAGTMSMALLDDTQFPDWGSYTVNDMTVTHYDLPAGTADFEQQNLRNRVSFVEVLENEGDDPVATYYSYDPHGNVNTLVQAIPDFDSKRTDYLYDLVSGNVNYVIYQEGEDDQFIHRYHYDEDNRLLDVYTSTDGFIWDHDAEYFYYPHGPLARVEIGEYNVQGLDYYYTLQGWIKGVNMPYDGDPGMDGATGSAIAKDEFAYTLGYFDGDYDPIGAAVTTSDSRDGLWTQYNTEMGTTGLFNGNIAWMATHLPEAGRQNDSDPQQGYQAMLYNYDQLHRIMEARSLTSYTPGPGFASRLATAPYDAGYDYDPNGNLLSLNRRDDQGAMASDFTYNYYAGTNKLQNLNGGPDYQYDEIGNLVADPSQKVTSIDWTPYGKVRQVTRGDGTVVNFKYDGSGNRIAKSMTTGGTTTTTRYIRDASGNVMAMYEEEALKSQPIYGSSRLGMYKGGNLVGERNLGNKHYELTNHLGNVLAVVTDNINMTDDLTTATVVSATDYYPFGLEMVGRTLGAEDYRYGFNGKEKDQNGEFGNTHYDYGFRIYNPEIGKFLSVDPLSPDYPWYTPYQFAGNMPIWAIDIDGLEPKTMTSPKLLNGTWLTADEANKILMAAYQDKLDTKFIIKEGNNHKVDFDRLRPIIKKTISEKGEKVAKAQLLAYVKDANEVLVEYDRTLFNSQLYLKQLKRKEDYERMVFQSNLRRELFLYEKAVEKGRIGAYIDLGVGTAGLLVTGILYAFAPETGGATGYSAWLSGGFSADQIIGGFATLHAIENGIFDDQKEYKVVRGLIVDVAGEDGATVIYDFTSLLVGGRSAFTNLKSISGSDLNNIIDLARGIDTGTDVYNVGSTSIKISQTLKKRR